MSHKSHRSRRKNFCPRPREGVDGVLIHTTSSPNANNKRSRIKVESSVSSYLDVEEPQACAPLKEAARNRATASCLAGAAGIALKKSARGVEPSRLAARKRRKG
jgi:hypothetical protein